MTLDPLEGFVVGITADRRAREQAALLRRRGAEVLHAPTIATAYLGSDHRLREATTALLEWPPSILVITTGIGFRAWLDAAQSWGVGASLLNALRTARLITRGPKSSAAAHAVGLTVWRSATDERMFGVRALLDAEDLRGTRVALQHYGDDGHDIDDWLSLTGADVVAVPVYSWTRPVDERPAVRLVHSIIEGRVHAVTFTAAPAVRHLFAIAQDHGVGTGLRDALSERVVAACVGPACADVARELGISQPVAPSVGRLGLMVKELTERLQADHYTARMAGAEIELQGITALIAGERIRLTHREARMLRALLQRPGAVISRAQLHRTAWRASTTSDHVVQVTIARLRRKLGATGRAIRTIPRRGYRIEPEPHRPPRPEDPGKNPRRPSTHHDGHDEDA